MAPRLPAGTTPVTFDTVWKPDAPGVPWMPWIPWTPWIPCGPGLFQDSAVVPAGHVLPVRRLSVFGATFAKQPWTAVVVTTVPMADAAPPVASSTAAVRPTVIVRRRPRGRVMLMD